MSPFSVNVSDRGLSVTRPGFPDRAGPASKGWQRDTGSSPWTPGCRGIGGREWTMTLSRPPWRGDHAPSPSSYWVPRGISPTARPRNYRSFSCSVDWASVLYARGATKSTGGKEEGTRAAVSLPPPPPSLFAMSSCSGYSSDVRCNERLGCIRLCISAGLRILLFFFLRPFLLTRAGVFFWGRWNSRRGARFDTGGAPVPAFRKLSMRHFIEVD